MDTGWEERAPADQVVEGTVLVGPASGAQVVAALVALDPAAEAQVEADPVASDPAAEGQVAADPAAAQAAGDGVTARQQLACGPELAAAARHLFLEWWPALRPELLAVAVSRPRKNSSRFLAR